MTMLEMLCVLFIMGMMAGAVALTLPPPPNRLEDDVRRFARDVERASQVAIVMGQPVGVKLQPGGYDFVQHQRGVWLPVREAGLDRRDLAFGVDIQLEELEGFQSFSLDRDKKKLLAGPPEILLGATGERDAFALVFRGQEGEWRVEGDELGALSYREVIAKGPR